VQACSTTDMHQSFVCVLCCGPQVLVVGDSGLGKTTLVKTLLSTPGERLQVGQCSCFWLAGHARTGRQANNWAATAGKQSSTWSDRQLTEQTYRQMHTLAGKRRADGLACWPPEA
jgi:septin family protein